ncbi:MAG: hypothetical protein JSR82_00010 [Verrucomicrobia bacterium]|nr:hypothetical protein [Verrucomicrobiota bacterium]
MNLPLLRFSLGLGLLPLLAGCTAPQAPSGSIVVGYDARTYGVAFKKPGQTVRSDVVEVVRTRPANATQIRLAEARCKAYMLRLSTAEKQFIRASGATHLCVFTAQSKGHQGEKTVMFWDTQTQSLVGNTVYEINNAPPDNTKVALPDFTVLHIGNGV